MEKIATDIYTFEKLRVNGFTYVDKTDRILPLADLSRGSQFFLARPRRFGKSLLVSTLKSLFPNEEVRTAFTDSLMAAYSDLGETAFTRAKFDCRRALVAHDLPAFFKTLSSLFANVPYDLTDRQNEQTWQAILAVMLNFLGFRVLSEVRTNRGRIDMAIHAGEEIYVVELKLDKSSPAALAQILKNRYYEKYLPERKRITLLGINFSTEKRGISSWRSKKIEGGQV